MKIFNYSTFNTTLNKATRSLNLTFKDQVEHGTLETLFELESLLNWAQARVEINAITINSEQDSFNFNFNHDQLKNYKAEYLEKLLNKIQTLTFKLMDLPQTIIFDLGANPHTFVFQLSLGADTRLIHQDKKVTLSSLNLGLSPVPGIMSLSRELFGHALTKKMFLSHTINSDILSGQDIAICYHEENKEYFLDQALESVNFQAPIARVQTKLALTSMIKSQLEVGMKIEQATAKANHLVEDWKNIDENFTPAQHMSYIMKYLQETQGNAAKKPELV